MRTKFALNVATVLLSLSTFGVFAQGIAFTYQGRLNNNLAPANGTYDFRFTVFDSLSGGSTIAGPVTNSTTAVSNGLFIGTLDFGGSAFSGADRWLDIGVRTNGNGAFTSLTPREAITPTPYAITAQSADNLSGLRIQLNTNGAPNVIGGSPANSVSNGVVGATIGGGGALNDSGIGFTNRVSGNYGTVSGGANNLSAAFGATVGGGDGNKAIGYATTVAGGENNTASLDWATVGGGVANTASGHAAIVCGGFANNAAGDNSFAAGSGANAVHNGSFVWSSGGSFLSTAANQFSVHAIGGVLFAADVQIGTSAGDYHHLTLGGGNASGYLYGSFPYFGDGVHLSYNFYADPAGSPHIINSGGGTSRVTAGYSEVVLAVGDVGFGPNQVRLDATLAGVTVHGTFNNLSDRNAKQEFAPVSSSAILDAVLQLPVSEWSYKEDPTTRHIGPVAQDFHSLFNIGTDDKHIAPIDEGGVAFAAIQGLNQKLSEELKRRDAENAELQRRLEALENLIRNQKSN